jgi:hypothetical protein
LSLGGPRRFGDVCRLLWPDKTAACIATIAGRDERTAKRWLSGEYEPPVVCVNDRDRGDDLGIFPTEGNIYTIGWIGEFNHPSRDVGRYIGVHLVEIDRPVWAPCNIVIPYSAKRFRPAVERKTNIDVFTDMLTPSPERVS